MESLQAFYSIFIILLIFLVYSVFIEPKWFKIRRYRIKSRKKILKPISVLHLSDIHFTKNNPSKESFFKKLAELEPDFIFLTGDIIDHDPGIETCVKLVGGLKAKIAKIMVWGNHDYWDYGFVDSLHYVLIKSAKSSIPNHVVRFSRELQSAGVRVLKNNSQKFNVNGTEVVIGGTDDPITQKVDFQTTLHEMKSDSVNILLTHVLDSISSMPNAPVDLVFSGHHHGGQVRLPIIGGFSRDLKLPRKTIDGYHVIQNMNCFASRGLGASRTLFLRFFCRPEAIWVDILPSLK